MGKPRAGLKNSASMQAFRILKPRDKRKLAFMTFSQMSLGVLDVLSVALIGALGAISIQGSQDKSPSTRVSSLLKLIGFNHFSFSSQVTGLGILAAILMLVKTFASVVFARKTIFFLSKKGAEISSDLVSNVLAQDLMTVKNNSTQETLYLVSDGVTDLMNGVLAPTVAVISDLTLLFILTTGLFIVDPMIAFFTRGIFF